MATARIRVLTALLAAGVLFGGSKPVSAQIDVDAVLEAIRDEYCIGEHWVPSPPRPPEVWPVAVRIDGDMAYAWVEQILKPKTQWVTFYAIARKGGKAVITTRFGYNAGIMQENPGYRESWNKVFSGDSAKHGFGSDIRLAELTYPFKCTRVFEPDTPAKLAIVDAIRKSMASGLTRFNKSGGGPSFPERVRIVIANFDAGDGSTYVYVRETNEVFGVLLDNGLADAPIDREYLVWQPLNRSEWPALRKTILATGIEREIRVGQ